MIWQQEEYQNYRLALWVCLSIAFVIALFVAIAGKQLSFATINGFNSLQLDYFFYYITYLGDGIIWVPLFLYVIFYKRKFLIPAIAAVIICTIITHFFKQVIFPQELRPLRAMPSIARAVPLLHDHDAYNNSFPSGHTSTAFTLSLLLSIIINKKWAAWAFPLVAFFVGYSRVYLAQHFVTDVLAGLIVGVISSYLALLIHLYFIKKKALRSAVASS